jgi:hypothetical protein
VVVTAKGMVAEADIVLTSPKRMEIGLRFEADQDHLIRFELTRSSDLKTYAGLYRLMDAEDGKGTVMFAELDLEVRGIPRFLSDGPAKKSVREAGEALKKHLLSLSARSGSAPAAAAPVSPPRKRSRRLLQVVQLPTGLRVNFMGKILKFSKNARDNAGSTWPTG